jgi:8-oxo-dGTP pyrophosphatase MutT (NUDIX family)
MSERAKFKGVVNLIIKQDDKILLFLRRDGFFNHNGGYWVLPAGHIEQGETAAEAAIREAKEELDIDILPEDVEFAHIVNNIASMEEGFDFFFIINKFSGKARNCEGDKCAEMRYFSFDELKELKNIVTTTSLALNCITHGIPYSECREYKSVSLYKKRITI